MKANENHYANPDHDIFAGYDWVLLSRSTASCDNTRCLNGGQCLLPTVAVQKQPSCLCPPGYTGNDCGTTMSSCAEKPCLNEAVCIEDPSGGNNYVCNCQGTGYRERHCQLENISCGLEACHNGGTCLPQPGGWLCQCPSGWSGMRCDRARSLVNQQQPQLLMHREMTSDFL